MYKTGSFKFKFNVNNNYPHEPPKVKCTQKVSQRLIGLPHPTPCLTLLSPLPLSYLQIYHPNSDLDGNVCLNILREDWKP
ncbi:ubiquitin-conjugating enzyme E2, partial [Acinetobacter baumannii]|uniref:ubiquitin-conjugating enzyme E2 n=1 Tax=Acinetobacter baumannii TaxID=470 RepID=UPI0031F3EE80